MHIAKLGAAFAVLLMLSACAGQPEIPYDRSASQANKTIGLLTVGWPSGPTSFLASDPGRSFGLIGALVDASIESGRETDLEKILADRKIDANRQFVSELTDNLQAKGFTVVPVAADSKRQNYLKKYPGAADNKVDSYLDVSVSNYGYLAAGIGSSNPYRPWLASRVKLVRAADGAVLMQDVVTYNSFAVDKGAVILSPDEQFAFVKWTDATSDPDKTATGVSVAAKKAADAIGDLLR
jgi:hypothetical protein